MGSNWTYEPSGDVDGDPRYDGIAGVDHFVMDGNREIACAPDERTARLMAAAPDLLAACQAGLKAMEIRLAQNRGMCNGYESDFLKLARAAVAAAIS